MGEWIPVFSFQWRPPLPFCLLFSSASKHNDETKSVASVQVTGLSASDAVCLHRSSYFDLFWSGFAYSLFCVSTSSGFSFCSQRSQAVLCKHIWVERRKQFGGSSGWPGGQNEIFHSYWIVLNASLFFFLFTPDNICKDVRPLCTASGVTFTSKLSHFKSRKLCWLTGCTVFLHKSLIFESSWWM